MIKIFKVDEQFSDMRIDRFIKKTIRNIPQGLIEKNLRTGKIKLNGKKIKSSHRIKKNDILNFYNIRRQQLLESSPNIAHIALNRLQEKYNLLIITQNIDDLHERSGNAKVLHLHGKLTEAKSTIDNKIYPIKDANLNIGDFCKKGGQLRPNVVWFGEAVPNMEIAINKVMQANIFIIIGTSLNVYPAASLLSYATESKKIVLIDPNAQNYDGVEIIRKKATKAVPKLVNQLLNL